MIGSMGGNPRCTVDISRHALDSIRHHEILHDLTQPLSNNLLPVYYIGLS